MENENKNNKCQTDDDNRKSIVLLDAKMKLLKAKRNILEAQIIFDREGWEDSARFTTLVLNMFGDIDAVNLG